MREPILKDRVWLVLLLGPLLWTAGAFLFGWVSNTASLLAAYSIGICASVAVISLGLPYLQSQIKIVEKHTARSEVGHAQDHLRSLRITPNGNLPFLNQSVTQVLQSDTDDWTFSRGPLRRKPEGHRLFVRFFVIFFLVYPHFSCAWA
jgi:hypothetical protein